MFGFSFIRRKPESFETPTYKSYNYAHKPKENWRQEWVPDAASKKELPSGHHSPVVAGGIKDLTEQRRMTKECPMGLGTHRA